MIKYGIFFVACLAAGAAISAVTAYGLAYAYALSAGHGALAVYASCAAALAISLTTPVAFEIALSSRHAFGVRFLCAALATVGAIFAMVAEISMQSQMQARSAPLADASAARDSDRLDALASVRSVATVEAEIAAVKTERALKRSEKQSKISALHVELAQAQEKRELEARLGETSRLIEASRGGEPSPAGRALASLAVHYGYSITAQAVTHMLHIFYAAVIEVTALFSVVIIMASAPRSEKPLILDAPLVCDDTEKSPSPEKMLASHVTVTSAAPSFSPSPIDTWLDACATDAAQYALASSLYQTALSRGMPRAEYHQFLAKLRERKFEKKKTNSGVAYKMGFL